MCLKWILGSIVPKSFFIHFIHFNSEDKYILYLMFLFGT